MLDWGSRRLFNVHGYGNDRLTLLDGQFVETTQTVLSLPTSSEGATLRRGSIFTGQDLGGISAMPQAPRSPYWSRTVSPTLMTGLLCFLARRSEGSPRFLRRSL